MSIIAGCFSKNSNLLKENRAVLENIVRDHLNENISIFENEVFFLIKNDIGAFSFPGWFERNGTVTVCAGDPLIYSEKKPYSGSRENDLKLINYDFSEKKYSNLKSVNGIFCAVHYDGDQSLYLISDKLGVRPLYFYEDRNIVIFSSQMKILEENYYIKKIIDIVGVGEVASFGFELGRRTPYKNIKILYGGEIRQFGLNDKSKSIQYWNWNDVSPIQIKEEQLLDVLYEKFDLAVRTRLGNDRNVFSFLSGGMDSRCVVTALRSNGAKIHSFTCSPANSQDTVFSKLVSEKLNTYHTYVPWEIGQGTKFSTGYAGMISYGIRHSKYKECAWPERANMVWTGDGGSVGVGHVYMSDEIITPLRKGNLEEGIRIFLEKRRLAQGLFDKKIFEEINEKVFLDVKNEICKYSNHEPGRSFHLFLMLNDQRRHLHRQLFESIDIHEKDLCAPFYDSSFLETIIAAPIDFFLRHSFYNKWMEKFPYEISKIPWQSYSNHEKCPLPIPPDLSNQWDEETLKKTKEKDRIHFVKKFFPFLFSKNFPSHIIKRNKIRFCYVLYYLRLKDTTWLLNQTRPFFEYWGKTKKSNKNLEF